MINTLYPNVFQGEFRSTNGIARIVLSMKTTNKCPTFTETPDLNLV